MESKITRPKLTITIDASMVKDRHPHSDDVNREIIKSIRDWCDLAEKYNVLGGNLLDSDGRIIGSANLPRVRTVKGQS